MTLHPLSLLVALAACGGAANNTVTPPVQAGLTVTGTAAAGKAIAGATVSAQCQVGAGNATTTAEGTYSVQILGGKLPCLLEVTNATDGTRLHTVATGSGLSAVANITPLTEMLLARVLYKAPAEVFAAFDSAAITSLTTAAWTSAQADVGTVLVGTVDTTALTSFITTPLKAATASDPSGGDAQDKLLDALKGKLGTLQFTQVISGLANTVSTADLKQLATNLAAGAPVANAGVDRSVLVGTTVTLDAAASTASAHRTLKYLWVLTSKPSASTALIVSSTAAKTTFVADVAGTYVATVVVHDGTTLSVAAAVSITAVNAGPIANAGSAQDVFTGKSVVLDGTASSDANGDTLTYRWRLLSKPAGSSAVLSSATSAKPAFFADVAGTYVASVAVSDDSVSSTLATVIIRATAPSLTLFEESGSLSMPMVSALAMPYSRVESETTTINCVGFDCAAVFDIAGFKLRAYGQNFTITNLTSTNSTVGSSLVPTFGGLTNGLVVADGSVVSFKLRSPITCNAAVTLNYAFTVLETGKSFSTTRSLRGNCS
jgi:hypothetical protein